MSGSNHITITIATEGTDANGTAISSDVSSILSAVETVDDTTLGTSLGTALGLGTLTVSSANASMATALVDAVVPCPKGYWVRYPSCAPAYAPPGSRAGLE